MDWNYDSGSRFTAKTDLVRLWKLSLTAITSSNAVAAPAFGELSTVTMRQGTRRTHRDALYPADSKSHSYLRFLLWCSTNEPWGGLYGKCRSWAHGFECLVPSWRYCWGGGLWNPWQVGPHSGSTPLGMDFGGSQPHPACSSLLLRHVCGWTSQLSALAVNCYASLS